MTESSFIEKNESQWQALEEFNRLFAKKGGIRRVRNRLNEGDIQEFARLFRLASHHMAYAKTHYPTGQSVQYLNRIVGVAHNHFYVRERSSLRDIWNYFKITFPQAIRDTWRYWGMATAFFVIGMLFAGFYVAQDPSRIEQIMPGISTETVAAGLFPEESGEFEGIDIDHTFFSAIIMTNNIAVSFNAFAFGLLAGIGTIYIFVYNGLIVGGLFGFLYQGGADMVLAYALILPHGVLELFAIFLCGGCGLMLGKGMLIPGEHSRKHSLILHAKKAAILIPGIVVILVIAGIIEGYFTPLNISSWAKIIFAAFTGAGIIAYVIPFRR